MVVDVVRVSVTPDSNDKQTIVVAKLVPVILEASSGEILVHWHLERCLEMALVLFRQAGFLLRHSLPPMFRQVDVAKDTVVDVDVDSVCHAWYSGSA